MRRTFQVTVVDPNYVCVWISGTVSEILKDQLNLVRVSLSLVSEHASIDIIHNQVVQHSTIQSPCPTNLNLNSILKNRDNTTNLYLPNSVLKRMLH
jgi:hypothetical protein